MKPTFVITLASAALCMATHAERAPIVNGFKLTNLRIERNSIMSGGVVRDGIPAIDRPRFIAPDQVAFLKDDDIVFSLTEGEATRAYPLRVLIAHEIVNDTISGRPVLVTYCPLCGTAMAFDRRVNGRVLSFGVSGLLHRSNVLMYDRESGSLWPQLGMAAVSGTLSGATLEWLPGEQLTWKAWRSKHPGGEVLSTDTGHRRDYFGNPYAGYFASPDTMFPVPRVRDDFPQKEWVIGVIAGGEAIAFPVKALAMKRAAVYQTDAGPIHVRFDPASGLAEATGPDGRKLPTVAVYWFAWQAFYPATSVW